MLLDILGSVTGGVACGGRHAQKTVSYRNFFRKHFRPFETLAIVKKIGAERGFTIKTGLHTTKIKKPLKGRKGGLNSAKKNK